jgi:hypothetical protein
MKIRVQKKTSWHDQLILDSDVNQPRVYAAVDLKDKIFELPLKGFYDILSGHLVILFKNIDNLLMLMIDDYCMTLDGAFKVSYRDENATGLLSIGDSNRSILIRYDISKDLPISTTYYSEESEDVNFGLWLSNVLNSEERKKILLEYW